MKRMYWLILLISLLFSGCGVEWFPDSTSTNNTTPAAASLTKSFNPGVMLEGSDSTLTFTITNGTGNPAQSGLAFIDTLPTGLTATATSPQCGGTATASGSTITFTGGSLAVGTASCTITATINGAANGNSSVTYTNGASRISALAGGLLNGVTDQTLQVFPFSVTNPANTITASNIIAQTTATAGTYNITVDVVNNGTAPANVTVVVVARDASGAIIPSTNTTVTGTVPNGPLATVLLLQNFAVPLADNARIQLWTIFSVAP